MAVNLGSGSGHFRSDAVHPEPLWDIRWQKGSVMTKEEGVVGGTLQTVDGQLYSHSKPGTRFSGDRANAVQLTQILTLTGNVKMVSKEPSATLTCDRMVYNAKRKLIKAYGRVQVVSRMGTVGTLAELWSTPDLKVVATPNQFESQ